MIEIQTQVYSKPPRVTTHLLLGRHGYCAHGSRYMTRTNMRNIFLGKDTHAIVRNNGKQRFNKGAIPIKAHLSESRLRIGCHVWSGENFSKLKEWALNG